MKHLLTAFNHGLIFVISVPFSLSSEWVIHSHCTHWTMHTKNDYKRPHISW